MFAGNPNFIKVTRVVDGDVDVVPITVHLEYPHLFPAFIEPIVEAAVEVVEAAVEVAEAAVEVAEAVNAVTSIPTKIKKGK